MKYLVCLFLLPALAFADSATDRESEMYFGGGLAMGQNLFDLGNGSTVSKFMSQGWMLEGGLTGAWGSRFGAQIGGEYGSVSGNNTLASQSTMETGMLKYLSVKGSLFYGPVTLGAGYRHNEVKVKSLSVSPDSYLETTYVGLTPFSFINYSLDLKKRFRTTIEGQYLTGTLKGSGSTTGSVKFSESSVSIRFFFLFD